MTNEIWREIEGFPGYQVSNRGNVRCFRDFHGNITNTSHPLKPELNKDDYYQVCLYTIDHKKVHKRIHRLVADAFLGKNDDLVPDHIDGDKHNNNISNLKWVTPKENSRLASESGLYKTKRIRVIETGKEFDSIKECAKALDADPSDISRCLSGKDKLGRDSYKGYHFELVQEKGPQKEKLFLYDYQYEAVDNMFNGCILNGGVGTGKSRTGLYYYFKENGGSIIDEYIAMEDPQDLYIITTAMKRDSLEWEGELANFLLTTKESDIYKHKVVVDSWNNIKKYTDIKDAFFIFDEDRVTGSGAWVKSFLKIAKSNNWIILSATSGDRWTDYIPVFVANGFYKNKTEFLREHVQFSRYTKYPKIERYYNTRRLVRLRDRILINMDYVRHTVPHHEEVFVNYDIHKYKNALKFRWDPYKNEPIQQASGLCYILRHIVNEDESRQVALMELAEKHPRMIVFYSYDYELNILKGLYYGDNCEIAEWNGHAHNPIPQSDRWVYLVQYNAGCEGWNCIRTDTIVFYSQQYSYKVLEQASGRIDRLNTPFRDLYYYHFKTRSGIDIAISKALKEKKLFNENKFVKW